MTFKTVAIVIVRDHGFVRVHRRALVAIAGVREVKWTSAGEMVLVLGGGVTIEVSRRRRAAVAAAVRSQASSGFGSAHRDSS